MAFCSNCGTKIPDGSNCCPSCGKPLSGAAQQSQPRYQPADPHDHTTEFEAADVSANKITAMASYLLGVFGIIISLLAAHDSKYAAFHARNALKLVICQVLIAFVAIIPFVGWVAAGVGEGMILVIDIICFVQVCKGQAKDAPIFGSLPFLK